MTVHFKGISEYRSKYKSRTTRSRSDSPHRRMRLAGLRSDQSRITREPQFISKRKVAFYPPQVSNSFRWEGHGSSPQRRQEKSRPVTPPAVTPVLRATSSERVATPLAPRGPVPPEGIAAPSHQLQAEAQAAQTSTTAADQQRPNGIHHALRRRAGLKSERQRNGRLNSEYQRQFMWKTPVADSPLLAAQEMLYSNNRAIPPFKSNPVIMESEYRRSFKGSPPPRPPRLRRDVEQYEVPLLHTENTTPEKSKRKKKKKKEQQHSRKSSPEEDVTHLQQQEVRSPFALRDTSPKAMRKVKTEYRSNFRSPLQYNYRDGAWVKARTAKEEECDGFHEWYHEVRDLREKAEAYRKRSRGTHFSRQHLNQILSDHNWMWEPSSGASSSSIESEACRSTSSSPIIEALDLARAGSARGSSSPGPSASVAGSRRSSPGEAGLPEDPTLPVHRKLAWDEEEGHGERDESEISEEAWNPKDDHGNMKERNERLQLLETESSSVAQGSGGSINGGRLPTPKLKTMQTVQRTHHDRTTPATGGALLVSPPKTKHSSRKVRRSEPPLGKPHSPYKHIIDGSPQRPHHKAENGSLPRSSPAAGLTTVDLLPMREDAWSEGEEAADYTHPRQAKPSQKQQTSRSHKAAVPPLANRIQGLMRNPEFQHNGDLGIFRPELFVFPESDSGVSDNDDKMSQISSRSAASCSVASELLGRAQRRKEEFWGKS